MLETAFSSLLSSIGYLDIFIAIFVFLLFWALGDNKNGVPRSCPFLGHFPALLFHLHKLHEKSIDVLSRTGGTFLVKGLRFTKTDTLATVDPANVKYIMSANFLNYPNGPEMKKIFFEIFGDAMFNSDFDRRKIQRKLARDLFTQHRLFHKCLRKINWNKVENGLIPILEHMAKEDRSVDLQDIFKRFFLDTTCTLITGFDSGSLSLELPDNPLLKAIDDALDVSFIRHILPESIWKLQKKLGIGPEKRLSKAVEVLDQVIVKYISMKRDDLSNREKFREDEEDFDLLTSYIINDGETTSGLTFDNKFLRDTVVTFLIAGSDTISYGLTWFFWLVSTHREVENNIREELMEIIPVGERQTETLRLFSTDELKNMVYLHAALCEALRLYPPSAFQHKTPLVPDILPSGHHVHPNMRVLIPLYVMGRMESIWGNDASKFKPERWISDHGTIKHEPFYKFFSFNGGPRSCLGREVAFTQMKTVVAAIIYNYHVETLNGHAIYPNVSTMLYIKNGFEVKVKKRWA